MTQILRLLVRQRLFWLVVLGTSLIWFGISLYQLGWLNHIFYGWAEISRIPFGGMELLLALAVALAFGVNVGSLVVLFPRAAVQRPGWVGGLGAGLSLLATSCIACQFGLLAVFLPTTVLGFLSLQAVPLQIISLLAMLGSSLWIVRTASRGCRLDLARSSGKPGGKAPHLRTLLKKGKNTRRTENN